MGVPLQHLGQMVVDTSSSASPSLSYSEAAQSALAFGSMPAVPCPLEVSAPSLTHTALLYRKCALMIIASVSSCRFQRKHAH